jgi:hypothetical protein
MDYEFLDPIEKEQTVAFYKSYFYGKGARVDLIAHLEHWPDHADWLVGETLFFLKNPEAEQRFSADNKVNLDIRDDQIWMYFTTGTDEKNAYSEPYNAENYPDRVMDISEFLQLHPFLIEIIVSAKIDTYA